MRKAKLTVEEKMQAISWWTQNPPSTVRSIRTIAKRLRVADSVVEDVIRGWTLIPPDPSECASRLSPKDAIVMRRTFRRHRMTAQFIIELCLQQNGVTNYTYADLCRIAWEEWAIQNPDHPMYASVLEQLQSHSGWEMALLPSTAFCGEQLEEEEAEEVCTNPADV